MWLLLADHAIKKPVGISCNVIVRVEHLIFLADFVIMDCEDNF